MERPDGTKVPVVEREDQVRVESAGEDHNRCVGCPEREIRVPPREFGHQSPLSGLRRDDIKSLKPVPYDRLDSAIAGLAKRLSGDRDATAVQPDIDGT